MCTFDVRPKFLDRICIWSNRRFVTVKSELCHNWWTTFVCVRRGNCRMGAGPQHWTQNQTVWWISTGCVVDSIQLFNCFILPLCPLVPRHLLARAELRYRAISGLLWNCVTAPWNLNRWGSKMIPGKRFATSFKCWSYRNRLRGKSTERDI
jgi:hypothetical protein